jgi:hypothetical protein
MAMFVRKGQHDRDADAQIPRAVAHADVRAVALGYLLGTACAAGLIAEVVTQAG